MEEVLKQLAERITDPEFGNGKVYLVGGAVRDELLGIQNKDFDVEVFEVSEEKLHSVLEGFVWDINAPLTKVRYALSTVGKAFQVFKIRDRKTGEEIDISLPRRDRKMAAGHRGFEVTADPTMTIKEAASRRDFTINSISKNILTGEIVDPFGGREDLEKGVIRMTNKQVFAEDPLRVLRAVQFAARFEFDIDFNTLTEMCKVDLSELPAERVFTEVEKLLMKAEKPSIGLEWLQALNVFPILEALKATEQDAKWHPEGNVFIHTCMVVDEAAKIINDQGSRLASELSYEEKLTVMLAALCHDFGKPAVSAREGDRVRAKGHEGAGVEPTKAFLDQLNVHSLNGFDVRGQVLALVENHLSPPQLYTQVFEKKAGVNVGRTLRRLSQKVRLDLLAAVSLADMLGRTVSEDAHVHSKTQIAWFLEEASNLGVEKSPVEPFVKGRDLLQMGMKAGPEMGRLLKDIFQKQIDGELKTVEEAIVFAGMVVIADKIEDSIS